MLGCLALVTHTLTCLLPAGSAQKWRVLERYSVDKSRFVLLEKWAQGGDMDGTYRLVIRGRNREAPIDDEGSFSKPRPLVKILHGRSHGTYVLYVVYNTMATTAVIYRLNGMKSRDIWSDVTKQGLTVHSNGNRSATIHVTHFGFQVFGYQDKRTNTHVKQIFEFRDGHVHHIKDIILDRGL
jgi:hypothetical protein